MNADQIQTKIVNGLITACSVVASAILFFLLYCASAATDLFYRRNFGERYFTPFRAWFGGLGWSVVSLIGLHHYGFDSETLEFKGPTWVLVIVVLLNFGYVFTSHYRFREIRSRINAGKVWHSRSRGESLFGKESLRRDVLIDVAVTVVLFVAMPTLAEFYLFSRLLGYLADGLAAQRFYNKFLDIRDAQIEAENMEAAMRDGIPGRAAGYRCPLPWYVKGDAKANVVRVLVPGAAPIVANDEAQSMRSKRSILGFFVWGFHTLCIAGGGSRRYFYISVVPAIFVLTCAVALFFWFACQQIEHVWYVHRAKSVKYTPSTSTGASSSSGSTFPNNTLPGDRFSGTSIPVQVSQPKLVNSIAAPAPMPPAQLAVQTPEGNSEHIQSPSSGIETPISSPLVVPAPPAVIESPAEIQRRERENLIKIMRELAASKIIAWNNFETNSQSRLASDKTKIKALSFWTPKKKLLDDTDSEHDLLKQIVPGDAELLAAIQNDLKTLDSNPQIDATGVKNQWDEVIADLEQKQDVAKKLLDKLDSELIDAKARKGDFR